MPISDINECDLDPCHRDADCVNKVGTFTCRCRGKDAIGDGINCCISEKTLNRIAKEEERAAGRSKREGVHVCVWVGGWLALVALCVLYLLM